MKEKLNKKIQIAMQKRENLINEANAIAGAIMAYQELIKEIDVEEKEKEESRKRLADAEAAAKLERSYLRESLESIEN